MMPDEQPLFFALVTRALGEYVKAAAPAELEAWWGTCKRFGLMDLERAFKAHAEDDEDGKRAPRPIDIKRRLAQGTMDRQRCAAFDPTGQCEYPGIFSEGTSGGESFWCPWHFRDRAGPEASRWIERSREIPWEVAQAKRCERMTAEAIRAPAVVATAHAIAKRHGDKPWQGTRIADPRGVQEAA